MTRFGPGQKLLAGNQRQQGWDAIMEQVSETSRQWWDYVSVFNLVYRDCRATSLTRVLQFLEAYDQLWEEIDGPGVKLASWHLQLIGTKPDRQRQGIGSALMSAAEQEAAKGKHACFVETVGPANVRH
jgi:GNAT superfamily N-acetyltransferase